MPKPSKSEAKQDFLSRCTAELIESEGREADQAYAMCNAYWDDAKSERAALTLSAPLELRAPEEDGEPPSFMITAYTGKAVDTWFGKIIFDVSGMSSREKLPILREHQRDRVVGYGNRSWSQESNYYVSGRLSQSTLDGKEIMELAKEGFPWQASVGIWPMSIKVLDSDKETETVNGQEIKGPAEIWTESLVGEVSFVALGADGDTAAIVLSDQGERVPVTISRNKTIDTEDHEMNLNELKEKHPDLFAQIDQAAFDRGREEGLKAGRTEERERVTGILGVENAALEAKIDAVKKGLGLEAAYKGFFEAAVAKQQQALQDLEDSAPQSLGQDAPAEPEPEDTRPADLRLDEAARKIMEDEKVSYAQACSMACKRNPELASAWAESRLPN